MDTTGTNRRSVIAGGLATGLALGLTAPASAQSQPRIRPDLYTGELDYLSKEFPGRVEDLSHSITIAGTSEPGERMAISGRCLSWQDGKPAAGVILYAYHTDHTGSYAGGPRGTRHARLRGWMKTGADGRYAFTSIKPAPYPDRTMPAHIHFIVLEPNRRPYWIDDIVFADEFKVDAAYRTAMELRGGNGITPLTQKSGVWTGARDIMLERHPA